MVVPHYHRGEQKGMVVSYTGIQWWVIVVPYQHSGIVVGYGGASLSQGYSRSVRLFLTQGYNSGLQWFLTITGAQQWDMVVRRYDRGNVVVYDGSLLSHVYSRGIQWVLTIKKVLKRNLVISRYYLRIKVLLFDAYRVKKPVGEAKLPCSAKRFMENFSNDHWLYQLINV